MTFGLNEEHEHREHEHGGSGPAYDRQLLLEGTKRNAVLDFRPAA
jgi:hypothetical protein